MIEQLYLLPLFPLLGFLFLALAGGRLARPVIAWTGCGSVGVCALLSALIGAAYLRGGMEPCRVAAGSWLAVDDLSLPFGFYLDALSLTMLLVVTGVGWLIHLYSSGFMADDADYARFFAYMNLFVSAMLLLVLADNLALLYMGWEGVGLSSYLLIGFWYQNPDNGHAARKAFVMTRVGDTALLLGLLLLFTRLHTLDIPALQALAAEHWRPGSLLPVAASALLLGGAVGKSAQLPLQSWLPDAMAGPTPVSALIHAATMVTAGIYLIARMHGLFVLAPQVQFAVALIGATTLLLAGFSALAQTDIKRILAYSTISQIGYMFLALGVGAWSAAIFHLLTHAFFKALLFLAAGAVIFCFHHEHDIFRMGGLRRKLPVAFWSFVVGCAALAGLPFTAGFYSKHQILLAVFAVSPVLWAAACFGAALTGFYSFRLLFVAFFGPENRETVTGMDWRMRTPLLLLCLLALGGALLRIPLASVFPLLPAKPEPGVFDPLNLVSLLAPFAGVLLAAWRYLGAAQAAQALAAKPWFKGLRQFWLDGWGFDRLYDRLWLRPFQFIAEINKNDVIDREYAAIARLCMRLHAMLGASQTGKVRRYAAVMGFGAAAIIAIGLLS
ncbi:MAG: NADH-quinone oxidoreductase subunit L [Methylococcales bacterium]|nr:NADH-quinone oxidoreductase subunit L [Methylococcales bacterium]